MHIELLFLSVFILLLVWLVMNKTKEGYTSLDGLSNDYYSFRTYNHNEYDRNRKLAFPNDYHPYEYNQRFNCYDNDLMYGLGQW